MNMVRNLAKNDARLDLPLARAKGRIIRALKSATMALLRAHSSIGNQSTMVHVLRFRRDSHYRHDSHWAWSISSYCVTVRVTVKLAGRPSTLDSHESVPEVSAQCAMAWAR